MYETDSIVENPTKQWLFSKVRQEDIYLTYLGYDTDLNKKTYSPFRDEGRPSFGVFFGREGDLMYRDFTTGDCGNAITFVTKLFHLSFKDAIVKIAGDLGVVKRNTGKVVKPYVASKIQIKGVSESSIRVVYREWNTADTVYWAQYGLTRELCMYFYIRPIKGYHLNGYYFDVKDEIAYAYYYGQGKYKVYRPKNPQHKWYANSDEDVIQGYHALPPTGDVLVITKALKDVGTLFTLGIDSVAPAAESVLLAPKYIKHLQSRFKKIYTLMDYDYAGIHLSRLMRKAYGTTPLFLTDGLWAGRGRGFKGCKDISDYRARFEHVEAMKLINKLLEHDVNELQKKSHT